MALFHQSFPPVFFIEMGAFNMKIFHSLLPKLASSTQWRRLACVVSSLALAAYVDLFVLNSFWTRLLLFVCAFVACEVFTYGASRLFKSAPSPKMVLEAIAAAALTLAVFQGIIFPSTQEVFITLISETAGEICLCDLVIDGENCPIADAEVTDNSGWLYRRQYDNFMIWPEEDGADNHLTMRFFANEVHVGFPYTPYAGSVTIQSSTGTAETLDLRCPEWEEGEAVQYADVPIDCRRVYPPMALIGCNAGFLLILSSLFLTVRYAVGAARGELVKTAPDTGGIPKPTVSEKGRNRRVSMRSLPEIMGRLPIYTKIRRWRIRREAQAHYGRWTAVTLGLTVAILSAFAFVTAYIDPLFHYHEPLPNYAYPLDDMRYQNDGITRNFEYGGLITGNSMVQNFKTSEAEALFGVPFIKVPFSGAYYKEINDNLRRGFAVKDISYVIRALDFNMIDKDKDAAAHDDYPNYLYNNNPFDDVNYVLNKSIFFDRTRRVLKYTAAGGESTTFDEYVNWNSSFTFGAEAVLASYSLGVAASSPRSISEEERQTVLENIRQNVTDLADEHPKTAFYLFFAPYSICHWDISHNNKSVDYWIDLEQIVIEELLQHPNIKLYCFFTNFNMICDLDNYKDLIHYGEWINSWMLEQMHDGNYLLTKDNYLEHLEAMREFYNSYDYASLHN